MPTYSKPSFGTREKLTHRMLHYIHNKTSPKYPAWRDTTVYFLFELFELMNKNPGINIIIHRSDGIRIYLQNRQIAYLHFCQQHFLVHAAKNDLILKSKNLFATEHNGSWHRMWKAKTKEEVTNFLNFLNELENTSLPQSNKKSRTIPAWVQEFVYERDGGRCVACGSKQNLCYDHRLPYIKGGSSDHPNNIQLLCSKCNSEKGTSFWSIGI